MSSRRKFLRDAGLLAGAGGFPLLAGAVSPFAAYSGRTGGGAGLKFSFRPYELQLKHTFTVAFSSRTTTPVMLTEIQFEDVTGYGEASMPPYLGESHASVADFYKKIDLSQFKNPFLIEDILSYVENIAPGNYAAKAAIDIALHDLAGKLIRQPWYRIWGLDRDKAPSTSFTIGIDKPEVVREKTREASEFNILKVKLGQGNDREMIESVREISSRPLCVDVNQGWKDRQEALDMIFWLKERGVVFVEQPMLKTSVDDIAWLTERSPLPVIADESLQTVGDLYKVYGVYSGVNIKLMKCGGMRAAFIMMSMARSLGMKVMIGCMTETSCAVTAAAQLSPMAEWADLDGNLLITNDLFEGLIIKDGKIILPERPGTGVIKRA
ncbi:MAG: dipeptide epimerase [Bacteroidales bacterium]|nr:dipeptide epimerase [Bacteroidales bacterium]